MTSPGFSVWTSSACAPHATTLTEPVSSPSMNEQTFPSLPDVVKERRSYTASTLPWVSTSLMPARMFLICNFPDTGSRSFTPSSLATMCAAPSRDIRPDS